VSVTQPRENRREEEAMKCKIFVATTASLLAALILSVRLAAQEQPVEPQHTKEPPRYVLVDLGTFGGPNSYLACCGALPPIINNRGIVVGEADTSLPDPYSPNCFQDCFLAPVFEWRNGILTNLGALAPGVDSFSFSINASGQIVGISEDGAIDLLTGFPETRGFLWQDGGMVDLGTLGGYDSIANAINDRGQVVGGALNTTPDSFSNCNQPFGPYPTQVHAFRWQDGVMRDLGTLGGNDSCALFINARGEVAGSSFTDSTPNPMTGVPTQDPFLWEGGTMIDLGSLGGTLGYPNNLNNRGEVVGQMNLAGDLTYHPFLWDRGVLKDLGTFGGDKGFADSINDAGEVVGRADLPGSQVHHAFLWKKGKMTDLGIPPGGGPCSTAYSINSKGQVVGDSGICNVGGPPFLWEHGVIYNLNDLVLLGADLTLEDVDLINDRGEIPCVGTLANGDTHACLLVPLDLAEEEGLARVVQNRPASVIQSVVGRPRVFRHTGRP
jgi:probable HAF family extracellular repeat protein